MQLPLAFAYNEYPFSYDDTRCFPGMVAQTPPFHGTLAACQRPRNIDVILTEIQNLHVTRILALQFLGRLSTDFRSSNVNRRQMVQCLKNNCSNRVLMSKLNLFCQNTCQIYRFRSTHSPCRCAYDRNYSSRRDESLLYESLQAFGAPFHGTLDDVWKL